MAFDARVFQILIASPGDVQDERRIISEVIQEWNYLNSAEKSIVLQPLRWETHAAPELNERPQGVINRQVVDHCDMAVGVFWTRLGTPTGEAESGTAEEIQRVGDAGKPVMVYFSRALVDPEALDVTEYTRLKAFKQRTYPQGLVDAYATTAEFRKKFANHLALKVRELVAQDAENENRDTDLRQPTGLQLRLAEGEARTLLPSDAIIEVEQVVCVDVDDVPSFHRDLVLVHLQQYRYRLFRLALDNTGLEGLLNVNLDLVVTSSTSDTELLLADSPLPTTSSEPNTVVHAHNIHVLHLHQPPLAQFILLRKDWPGRWRIELDLPAIQPGRMVFSRNEFLVGVTTPSVITMDCTVYSSDSAPFTLRTTLEIKVNRREMSWRDIVAEYQVG